MNISKDLSRKYILFMFIIILTFTTTFLYFLFSTILALEKKQLLDEITIIESVYKNNPKDEEIQKIFQKNNIYIALLGKNGKTYFSTKNGSQFIENFNKILLEKFLDDNRDFYYNKNKLSYIKAIEDNRFFIIVSKQLKNFNAFVQDILLAIFLTIIIGYLYINFIMKKFNLDFIKPIKNIHKDIMLIQKNDEKIKFSETKFDEINQIYKALSLINDATENMVYNIKTQNNKIEYILDNMNEGFILFDKNRKVFTINKIARKILNCLKEPLGENIIYYTQNIKILDAIENLYINRQNSIFDIKYDNRKTYSVYISRIEKGVFENEYNGGIMLLIDVTAERENQKMKQEFFSNVSHELKTPITSIQGYAELLYNDFAITKEQEKEFLKRITKEAHTITDMINNILIISKLENNYIDINRTKIKVNFIIEEIIQSTKPLCLKNNIKIFNECDDIEIFTDYKMLHQLFNNLIVNAIKYNKEDGNVYIKCFEEEKNLYISIKDTGIGIPFKDKYRIFERFYRVEKGRSKNLGGTGLGLSIVKHIVNYHNGTIKIKSKENCGTEFIIKLPKN